MKKDDVVKMLRKVAIEEKERLEKKCGSHEGVEMFPVKYILDENGFLDRISVLNTKAYMIVNEELKKDFCPVCGKQVDTEMFICDTRGQKMHIECYRK